MSDRLGDEQLRLLGMLGRVGAALLTPDRVSASLLRRGLIATSAGGVEHITPAGLRALADAAERGRISLVPKAGMDYAP